MAKRIANAALFRLISASPPPGVKIGMSDIPSLTEGIEDRSAEMPHRRWYANLLRDLGTVEALEVLIRRLQDRYETTPLRRWCATLLGTRLDYPPALTALVAEAWNSDSPQLVRGSSAEALGSTEGEAALIALLESREIESYVQGQAALGAARLVGNDDIARALVDLMTRHGTLGLVREISADSLSKVGGPVALEALIGELRQPANQDRAKSAARGLGVLGGVAARDALIASVKNTATPVAVRVACTEPLRQIKGDFTRDKLIALLTCGSTPKELRIACALSLGMFRDGVARGALLTRLQDPGTNADLRIACATALGDDGDVLVVETLIALLRGPNPAALRIACAMAIGKIGDPQSRDALTELLADAVGNVAVRAACASSLEAFLDADVCDALILALIMPAGDNLDTAWVRKQIDWRIACARSLASFPLPAARTALIGRAQDPNEVDEVRVTCIDALYPLGPGEESLYEQLLAIHDSIDNSHKLRHACAACVGIASDDNIVLRHIEAVLTSGFKHQSDGRPPGGLRRLYHSLGYEDGCGERGIDHWLSMGAGLMRPGEFALRIQELAQLCFGHFVEETCDCPDHRPDGRDDYCERKCFRCAAEHAVSSFPTSWLRDNAELFLWRAIMGQADPLAQARAFVDTLLFPLLMTPDDRSLTWEWRDDQLVIIVAQPLFPTLPEDDNFPPGASRRRVPILWCASCPSAIGNIANGNMLNHENCYRGWHHWELRWVTLNVAGDFTTVHISCCKNGHAWHPETVHCPVNGCGMARRRGADYHSVRVYLPSRELTEDDFEE